MFDGIKSNWQLRKARKQLAIKNTLYETKSIEYAADTLTSALEARNSVRDRDLDSGQWMTLGGDSRGRDPIQHKNLQESAYSLYRTNPHARAIVRGLVKFTLGRGPQMVPVETDETKKEQLLEEWKLFKKNNKFSKREKELATRLFRDGEVFIRKFIDEKNGDLTIRFIRTSLIANPVDMVGKLDRDTDTSTTFGITTSKDDIEEVIQYYKVDGDGKYVETIPAEEIYHLKIYADSDEKRGTTVYEPCIRRLTQYDEWLEDRIVLNKVRSAIALIRQVDGGAGKVKETRDAQLSDTQDESRNRSKMMDRGTVITASKGVEYKLLSANINATDVKDDGREIKLAIASAVGFPEMIFTADYANANYSSSLIAQNPFVREIEEWQDFLSDFYFELFDDVIQAKKDFGEFPENIDSESSIEFPPMMRDDLDKIAKAFEILFRYKAVSKKTWMAKMGLDPEIENINMEEEDEDELLPGVNPNAGVPGNRGGTSPFNMPRAPVNQFGAEVINEMVEAVKDQDWEKLIELSASFEQEKEEVKVEPEEREPETTINLEVNPEINITSPETKVDVLVEKQTSDIMIEPTQVKVKPEITIEQPNIEVTTPDVTIENKIEQPEVNINMPEVKVNVEQPNIKIDNIIEQQNELPRTVIKKVIRDKDNIVIGIEEVNKLAANLLSDHGYIEEAHYSFAEQDWIYLIHHMHTPEKGLGIETLHHCFLFDKKNLTGNKYEQKHVRDEKIILHSLVIKDLDESPEIVYDHLNNGFKVRVKEVEEKKYAILTGLVNLKKTKWSAQDK